VEAQEERTCSITPGCQRRETSGGGCLQCKFSGGVRVNGLALFAHDREIGLTQMGKVKEMFEGVKENQGRVTKGSKDIQAVRGRRGATQVYRNDTWVST
jgi:hypothetical protein